MKAEKQATNFTTDNGKFTSHAGDGGVVLTHVGKEKEETLFCETAADAMDIVNILHAAAREAGYKKPSPAGKVTPIGKSKTGTGK